ncbi:MAG: cytochrome c oxidase subunit II [Polyangiaceae bacterium]|nr:cytochrome c oxidase subunit II [Polyangiaceae bacterium]MCW5792562.1 cytochrome c oxidase subunit II [Polyangiaceae bacterium]
MTYLSSALLALMQQDTPKPKVPESPHFWMPTSSSTFAEATDWAFDFVTWVSAVVTIGVVIAMTLFCVKYRATDRSKNEQPTGNVDHSNVLEIAWSVIPLPFVIAFFVVGLQGFINMRTPPKEAYEIHATAAKWSWMFQYPSGYTTNELHVPKDRPVKVIIEAQDVIHAFYVPAFRQKIDAVPGRYTHAWFEAIETGEFPLFCAEYCGTNHSDMITKVVVHEKDAFEEWLEEAERKEEEEGLKNPVAYGETVYKQAGCATCHSLDGSPKIGPTFKGLFGKTERFTDGTTAVVDENYLRESIEDPQAKIVDGFPASMPTYKGKLSNNRLRALVEFIKSQK